MAVIAEGVSFAAELMEAYAEATGLTGGGPARRYLWTDAFAVCNFLGLRRELGEARYLELALRLVHQVHRTLGRHRPDDTRRGWLSGLDEETGAVHPTRGGLRIGKELPERRPGEPIDPQLEWDRDGQYFHYLARWIHALHRVAAETGEAVYDRWAVELAVHAHAAFTYAVEGERTPRMVWKMSTDLSRPLVGSMGHHDPLDALITYLELRTGAPPEVLAEAGGLDAEIAEAAAMCAGRGWATDDPLGIGGLLTDAAQLSRVASGVQAADGLLPVVLADAAGSLRAFEQTDLLRMPPDRRLAFRELGLSIGLHAIERTPAGLSRDPALAAAVEAILERMPLTQQIERTWAAPSAQRSRTWLAHRDIDTVMLATSLAPAGYLGS